ncbi:MAG: N-acetyltransferase [Clostridiales bacterium]|nr:N-acetyltransferase [Clostridiales bacterium]
MIRSDSEIKLRTVSIEDTDTLLSIYRPYVENATVTMEYDAPTHEEFAGRIRDTSGEYPYLVCERDGNIVGYAYAHRYKQRYGYRFCAELSVYVSLNCRRSGLGSRMYGALIELMQKMGYLNLYGLVTDPNPASFGLHRSLGFKESGREHIAGYKFGDWHDVVLFERIIGEHNSEDDMSKWRDCPRRFDELLPNEVEDILSKYSN